MKFIFKNTWLRFLLPLITCFGCTHGYILTGRNHYNEKWSKSLSQSVQESLGSGYTVTTLEGDDRGVAISGSGFSLGSTSEFGAHLLDVDFAFYQYPDINYNFSSTNGSTTHFNNVKMQGVIYSHVGLGYGYRLGLFTPVVSISKSGFSMSSLGLGASGIAVTTINTSNYFAWAGLKIELPLFGSTKLLLRGTTGVPLIKDSAISSAGVYDLSAGLSW